MNTLDYEVYERLPSDGHHVIALCYEASCARAIAYSLAKVDPKADAYYVGPHLDPSLGISPGDWLIPGGGWYDRYQRGDDGEVRLESLS